MISNLNGILSFKKANSVVIDVNGVGYLVYVPLKSLSNLPEVGKPVSLYIQTIFNSEEGIFLYGFLTEEEREVFNFLRQAKGVGVKTAFSLLSFFEAEELITYIEKKDAQAFLVVPGIGKKTAERIIFELKDKVRGKDFVPTDKSGSKTNLDAELALVSLGYTNKEAKEAVAYVIKHLNNVDDIQVIVKESLKYLMKR
jgi:Holliday junction DNA helicase RuvA